MSAPLALFALAGIAAFACLWRAGFAAWPSMGLTILVLGQAGPALALRRDPGALLLMPGVALLGLAITAFAANETIRRIIACGAALSAIQCLAPLGTWIALTAAPGLIALNPKECPPAQRLGLWSELFFAPLVTGLLLIWVRAIGQWPYLPAGTSGSARPSEIAAAALLGAPVLWAAPDSGHGRAIALLALALPIAELAAWLAHAPFGRQTPAAQAAMLTLCGVAAMPLRPKAAIGLASGTLGLSWILAAG